MTTSTQTRAKICPRCNFRSDQLRHFQQCVPTRYWPAALRDRKATAMHVLAAVATCCDRAVEDHPYFQDGGWHFATVEQRAPGFDRVKPGSLYEYRRAHPEANPLVGENQTRVERRKNVMGDEVDMEVVVSLAEARGFANCQRCGRPMLVANAHLDCRPRALTGPGWYDRAPAVEPPTPAELGGTPVDDPELADFLDPGSALRRELQAEAEAGLAQRTIPEGAETIRINAIPMRYDSETGVHSAFVPTEYVPQPGTDEEWQHAPPTSEFDAERAGFDLSLPAVATAAGFACSSCERVLKTRSALLSHEKSHQRSQS